MERQNNNYCKSLIDRLYTILCFFEQDVLTRRDFIINVEHEVTGAAVKTGLGEYVRLANKLAYIRSTFGNDVGAFLVGTERHLALRKEIMSCIRIVEGIWGEQNAQ